MVNLEHIWENAKAYDFLGNFTQSGYLGGYSQAICCVSELSSLIVLLFDLPLVDIFSKYTSLKFLYLSFYIFGTFGAYLFFRYGLKLSNFISTLGGLGFFWGNSPFLSILGGEYTHMVVQFMFFPWVLLFIKLAYSYNKPGLSCLAGLIASLSEYAMSSHPESDFLYFIFCNLYNLYLALTQVMKSGFQRASVKRFFCWLLILPAFWAIGLAYRVVPLVNAILAKEYAAFDSSSGLGLWWNGWKNGFMTLFFRYENLAKTGPLAMGVGEFQVGTPVFFFIGQPLLFFAFAFAFLTLFSLYKAVLKKPNQYSQYAMLNSSLFFSMMYLFLSWQLPYGNTSLLDAFMDWAHLRVHNAFRLTTYYFFFGLVTAMFGLNFLLRLRRTSTLNIIFITFIIFLGIVYILPLPTFHVVDGGALRDTLTSRPVVAKPDKFLLDGLLLLGGYLLLLGHTLTCRIKKSQLIQFSTYLKILRINKIFPSLNNT